MTEDELAGLGYADTIVFRPGLFTNTERPRMRFMESFLGIFTGLAAKVAPSLQIDVSIRLYDNVLALMLFVGQTSW